MKVYIYCTKAKPYLLKESLIIDNKPRFFTSNSNKDKINDDDFIYNGNVVASFDLNKVSEVELAGDEIKNFFITEEGLSVEERACLEFEEIETYLSKNDYKGYAWHIENLKIFDEPMELSEFYHGYVKCNKQDTNFCLNVCKYNKNSEIDYCRCAKEENMFKPIFKAPQSWCYAYDTKYNDCILISIKPQQVEKILNGEQTIIVKKTAPKEMLK